MPYPYALLRAGFPYVTTIGMRRVTSVPVDIAIGEDRVYSLGRIELGNGGTVRMVSLDDEDLGTMADEGLVWPVGLALDPTGNLFISDEAEHKITVYSAKGEKLEEWGSEGSEPGELHRPSAMAFDASGDLFVVDTGNDRVQKFSRSGEPLGGWGSAGSGEGELSMPWGIHVDVEGDVYIADWRNDRIQKFSPQGEFLMGFGGSGQGDGQFTRPSGVAVDEHGDIYVADRGNNRVQLFDRQGRYVEKFLGEATLSKQGRAYILANQKTLRLREMTSVESQKRFLGPTSVRVAGNRMYVADTGHHRIQIYEKDAMPLSEEQIMAPLGAPTLLTT